MDELITRYNLYIHNRYQDLIKSGKKSQDLNNFDLAKIGRWQTDGRRTIYSQCVR
jgi:hypothetical protein